MRRTRKVLTVLVVAAGLAVLAGYLRDPPWLGRVTSGLGEWQGEGMSAFRWTRGHASFFVPSDATTLVLPLRGGYPGREGRPVTVMVWVDDRWVSSVALSDPEAWVRHRIVFPAGPVARRHRRIDLRVDRTVGDGTRGVQLGRPILERPGLVR